ncbi:MAG: hypothetical protein HY689_14550 [Chloroflexi bacterium]|nr:hypothetical protein [Chloroflexota bacterium]
MALLDDLMAAQRQVFDLQQEGKAMTAPEVRRAMNRLMGLLRQATPADLAAFTAWKNEEQRRRAAP